MTNQDAPDRIWIEEDDGCPYFYDASELAEAGGPLIEYIRADLASTCAKNAQVAPAPVVPAEGLVAAIREAIDLLAERKHGSPARSPGHNARLVLEAALRSAPPVGARVTVQEAARVLLDAIGDYDRNRGHSDYDPSLPVGDALLSALAALLPAGEGE